MSLLRQWASKLSLLIEVQKGTFEAIIRIKILYIFISRIKLESEFIGYFLAGWNYRFDFTHGVHCDNIWKE